MPTTTNMCKLRILYGIAACATLSHQALSFSTVSVAKAARTWAAEQTSKRRDRAVERQRIFGFSSSDFPPLFAKPLDEEKAENKKNVERWDDEESLLVMSLRPLPGVSCEDSLSRISQYVRGFPVAALLPVQPLQALPTDDGGLDVRFLRRSTRISSGLDGGVRFFVRVNDQSNKKDRIEVVIKRNSEGQSTPKMIAEKLIVQSFAKGMAMGGNPNNDNDRSGSSLIRVPNTRIVSPTKDMAEIQSVFHKWVGI